MSTFYWQEGRAAFTVSLPRPDRVRQHVHNQPAHHRQRGFAEEVRELLDAHGIEYDERYLLNWARRRPYGAEIR